MGLINQETNYFGLDIGTTAIRLVQVRGGGKPALVTYGDIKVPPGLTSSDAQADRVRIAEYIRQLVHDTRASSKKVVASLPSANVFASVLTMPKLSDAEIGKAIRYQADQYIPMAVDEVKLDWTVLDKTADEANVEVLLVAAPIRTTEKYLQILEGAGLEIVALEADATAVARALVPVSDIACLVLDMSSLSSDLTIVYKNTPRLLRSITIGLQTLIRAVGQNLGLEDAQAEQFTFRFGLTQTKLEGQVLKAVKPSIDLLVSEIDKSMKFFNGRYPQVKLEKLVLTGTAVSVPELTTYLANALGLPIEIGNAWINVSYPASQQEKLLSISNEYAVASGLAQRSFI